MINTLLLRLAGFTYQRTLVIGLVIGVFYFFTMFDTGSSLTAQITKLKSDLAAEEAKERESDIALREVEKIRGSIGALKEQFKSATQQLPTEIPMAEILKSLDTLARSSGVSIKDKEPRPPVREDFLEVLPLRVRAEGSFSEITMFIYYISSMQRITRLKGFTISKVGEKSNRLVLDGEVASYRFVADVPSDEVKR